MATISVSAISPDFSPAAALVGRLTMTNRCFRPTAEQASRAVAPLALVWAGAGWALLLDGAEAALGARSAG